MPCAAKRRQETQLRRRVAKQRHSANGRWMQLSSAEVNLLTTIQVILCTVSTFITAMTHLLALVLAYDDVTNEGDDDKMSEANWDKNHI
jgi:hypothetical protein